MSDNILAWVNGIIQFLLLALGAYVTLESEKVAARRMRFFAAFMVLGGLGIAVNIWQQVRNNQAADTLQTDVGKIAEQTKQPPNVTVNVPSPIVQVMPAQAPPVPSKKAVLTISGTDVTKESPLRFVVECRLRNSGDGDTRATVQTSTIINSKETLHGIGGPPTYLLPAGQVVKYKIPIPFGDEATLAAAVAGKMTMDVALDVRYDSGISTVRYRFVGRVDLARNSVNTIVSDNIP